jgi:hypothetical protein
MVIKSTFVHSGWSYGRGDDQYDNDSVGSTETVVKLKKLMENSSSNKKNEYDGRMCSRQEDKQQHTNDQGWTTIETYSKRKPKSKNSRSTSIDSIISSIDIDFNIDKNGTLEATIDSPAREYRCTIPDITNTNNKSKQESNEQRNLGTTTTKAEEECKEEKKDENIASETTERKNYGKKQEKVRREDKQNVKETTRNKEEEMEGKETWTKTTTTTTTREVKISTELKATIKATNGQEESMKDTTRSNTNEKDTNINNNDKEAEESTDKNNTNNTNTNNKNKNNNRDNNNKNHNNGNNNKTRVNIVTPGEMATYAFTISWRPEHKVGQDERIIIRMLMREMAQKTPQITCHPTNSASSPVPRDINNINNDFPTTSASYDDFFDQMRNRDNTNQRTLMKVTMPHDKKELQRKSCYNIYKRSKKVRLCVCNTTNG